MLFGCASARFRRQLKPTYSVFRALVIFREVVAAATTDAQQTGSFRVWVTAWVPSFGFGGSGLTFQGVRFAELQL